MRSAFRARAGNLPGLSDISLTFIVLNPRVAIASFYLLEDRKAVWAR